MDRSTKIDGLTPIATDSQQQHDNNQQSAQSFTDKKIITNTSSSFMVDTDKSRKIAKQQSTTSNKNSSTFFDYINRFKNNTSKNLKLLVASSLILLAPVLGCVVVAIYLLASHKADKREATSVNYTNPFDEDNDNNLEEMHNLFEIQPLTSLYDEKSKNNVSEKKVRNFLINIFQQNIEHDENNKARIPLLNKLAFELAPMLTNFLNSQSNNQHVINKAIKTVLVYIKDEELYKINAFFETVKNDQQIMATLTDDHIAMEIIKLSQGAIKNK